MFGINRKKHDTEDTIQRTVVRILKEVLEDAESTLGKIKTIAQLNGKVKSLREELETEKIEKGRQDEDRAKKDREVDHKIGLERKRQEFEVDQAKREATVSIREENLKADRDRFEGQMEFQEKRFTKEVGYLKDMMGEMMKRLPTAEIIATLEK